MPRGNGRAQAGVTEGWGRVGGKDSGGGECGSAFRNSQANGSPSFGSSTNSSNMSHRFLIFHALGVLQSESGFCSMTNRNVFV